MRAKRLPLGLKLTKKRKFMKRLLIIGLSLFVILSQLSLSPLGKAYANNSSATANNQFFDSVKLTTGTADTTGEKAVSDSNPIKKGERVHLGYSWTQKAGQTLTAGQNVTIRIPGQFQLDKDLTGNVKLVGNQTIIGTYTAKASGTTADANTLTVHFNSNQTSALTHASGELIIPAVYNADVKARTSRLPIEFDLGNNQKQTIAVPITAADSSTAAGKGSAGAAANSSSNTPAVSTPAIQTNSLGKLGVKSLVKAPSALASTAAPAGTQITQNILTGVTLTDANGNTYNASNPASTSSPANIDFTWSIPDGLKVNDGDYYTFKLPNDFAIYNPITGSLNDGSGNQVGTFIVAIDGTVTMTFINNTSNNNYFDNHTNVAGTLGVHTQFNSQTITGPTQQQITFPINQPVTLTIPFKPSKVMDSVDKQGTPDKNINPTSINWTVNINQAENTLTNAKLTDPTLTGLSLNTGSIQVYPLTVNVDGTTTVGSSPVPASDYTVKDSDGNLEIDFNNPISSAYQIRYSTAITDAGKDIKSFDNKATLSSDGISPLTADATVTNTRGDHLKKTATGYNASTQTITWTINYNGDDKSIADETVLHDLFDNTQSLDGSVQVYHATVDANGNFGQGALVDSGSGAYTVTPATASGKNGFDLTFTGTGNSGAYQIVYKTKANGLVTANNVTVNNSVQENSGTAVNSSKGIYQQGIIKSNTGANYANKTTTWKITVNGNNYQLNNAAITDTFDNAGLSLQNGTFKIHDDTSNTDLTEGTDYTLNPDANGFTVAFEGAYASTSDAFTITYTTDFNYANLASGKTSFSNTSKLSWTDANGDPQSSTSTAPFNPDRYTKSNGFKNGSYNAATKQITWNIGVNYNLATITDPVISDPITGNQQYIDGSLEVHSMTLTGGANGITVGDPVPAGDYTVDYPSNDNSNTLTIHFKNAITTPYYITYKTSLAGQVVNQTYNNTATVKDGNTQVTTLPASVSPANGGTFASKSGAQDGNYVDWTVNINSSQSTISNAQLDDTPTNNQIIDPNSFHLYPQTVDTNGNLTTDTSHELQQGKDYTLVVNTDNNTGAQTFTIKFANAIDSAYQLTYRTMINANDRDTLGNTATLSGSNTQTVSQQTSQSVIVRVSSGSGTGSGVNGSLTVFKDDAVTHAPLSGATFTLYDSTGKTPLRTLTTGSDGKVAFNNFKYGNYILKETQAPVGYTIGDALVNGTKITIDASSSAAGAQTTIDDNQNKVTLTKQDVNGNGLTGATFSLLKDGQPYPFGHAIQSVDGKVEIDGLVPGNYQLTEASAPAGYLVNSTPINFTVTKNANDQIPDVNLGTLTDYQGSAQLTKTDSKNVPLPSAVFNVVNKDTGHPVQSNLTSGIEGKVSAGSLAPGHYYFVETEAPEGYVLNTHKYEFTIVDSAKGEPAVINAGIEINYKGSAELTKTDEGGNALQGAVFKVVDNNNKIVQDNLTSGIDGKVSASGLAPGTYDFVETKAPAGYVLNTNQVPFTINGSADGTPVVVNTGKDMNYKGSVQLTKQDDSGHPLVGATFKIVDGGGKIIQSNLASGTDGKVSASGLAPGTYDFVETRAPAGYVLNTDKIGFTIASEAAGKPILVTTNVATNYKGSATLNKVDSNGNALGGAIFSVIDDSTGNIIQSGLSTDQTGHVSAAALAPGTYDFVETKAPTGYILNTDKIKFTISDQAAGTPVNVDAGKLINYQGSVELTKTDSSGKGLEGALFDLKKANGDLVKSGLKSDTDGKITVNELVPEDYQFIETQAPDGYQLDAQPIIFTIDSENNGQPSVIPLKKINTENSIVLTKVDANDRSAKLQGAEFQLQDSKGNAVTNDVKGKTLPSVWTTDSNGQFTVNGLASGSYQFEETQAPSGYQLDATPIPFKVTNTDVKAIPITAYDKLTPGDVRLTKVDKNDKNIHLQGAGFKLEDSKGKTLKTGLTTDSNGQFVVKGLAPGNYFFVETQAPKNYQLDATPIPFVIAKGQTKAVEITATDKSLEVALVRGTEAKTPSKSLPTTGDTSDLVAMMGGAILLLSGGVLAIFTRRRRKNE